MANNLTYTPTKGKLSGVFTVDENDFSKYHGILRTNTSRKMNLDPLKSGKLEYNHDHQMKEDIRGVYGELAVANFFGIENWIPTINKFKNPDVLNFQVRASWFFEMRVPIRENDILTYMRKHCGQLQIQKCLLIV